MTFPPFILLHAYLGPPFPSSRSHSLFRQPCHLPFHCHTSLSIITCRRGSSSSLSRTLTHYAYLLIFLSPMPCTIFRPVVAGCYDFSSLYPLERLSRTILSRSPSVLPFCRPRHLPRHYHTSLYRHLPTWLSFTFISDLDSLCLPPYLLISDILYDTQTRCGRPFPGLSCI